MRTFTFTEPSWLIYKSNDFKHTGFHVKFTGWIVAQRIDVLPWQPRTFSVGAIAWAESTLHTA